jgi:hypothetical protein
MFVWFSKKKEDNSVKEETKKGFELVKKDISSITGWIKHLDSEKELQKKKTLHNHSKLNPPIRKIYS